MCRTVVDNLIKAGLIVESQDVKSKEGIFTPAIDISKITFGMVLSRIEGLGELKRANSNSEVYYHIRTLYNKMEDVMYTSEHNKKIADI
jgi:DNA-binding IscR family transcriptional regulator